MRILFISSSRNFFGGEKVLLNLAEYFIKNWYRVHIIIPGEGTFSSILKDKGIDHSFVNIRNSVSFDSIPDFIKVVKKFKPDYIHSHGYIVNIISRIVSRLTKKPVFCVLHSMQDFKFKDLGWKAYFYKYLDLLTNRLAYKCINIAVSKPVADTAKYLKCIIIPNGVELPAKEYNIPEKIVTFGIVGRIVGIKGIGDVLKAWKLLKDKNIEPKLKIIGEDITPGKTWKKKYRDYVEKYNLNVEFIPFQKNVENIYTKFDSLIFASYIEACPLTPLEALIRKKLVLYSDIKGSKFVMRNHGIKFKKSKVLNLKKKLQFIINMYSDEIFYKVNKDFRYALLNRHSEKTVREYIQLIEES